MFAVSIRTDPPAEDDRKTLVVNVSLSQGGRDFLILGLRIDVGFAEDTLK